MLNQWKKTGTLQGHSDTIIRLVIFTTLDGDTCLASGGEDETIKIWKIRPMSLVGTFESQPSCTVCALTVFLHPDGRMCLASGHLNGDICLWDLKSQTLVKAFREHTAPIWSFTTFTQKNGTMCLASGGNVIKIWNVESLELMRELGAPDEKNISNLITLTCHGKVCLVSCNGTSKMMIWEEKERLTS